MGHDHHRLLVTPLVHWERFPKQSLRLPLVLDDQSVDLLPQRKEKQNLLILQLDLHPHSAAGKAAQPAQNHPVLPVKLHLNHRKRSMRVIQAIKSEYVGTKVIPSLTALNPSFFVPKMAEVSVSLKAYR